MLDHDGVGQALLALPLAHDERDPARVRQDRHQQGLRVVACQVGQVERQARTDHDRVDPGLERGGDRRGIGRHRAHHVDRQQPAALREMARRGDLAAQRLEVGLVDHGLERLARREAGRAGHQVGVMPAQVDRRDRPHRPERGHAAGQAVGRHADAHAALDDRQQVASAQVHRAQAAGGQGVPQAFLQVHGQRGSEPVSTLRTSRDRSE